MKKFIIPLLIIFSSLISANLFSQNTITFTIGTIQAIPGQLVSIPISISGANGTNAIGVGQFYIFHTSGITKSGSNVGFTYDSLTNPIEWLGNLNYNSTTISNTWMSSNFNDVSFPDGYILFYINVIYNGPDTVNLTWGTSGITETMVDNSLGTLYGTVNFNFNNGKIIPAPPIPTAPNLLSPANDSTGVSHSPTLSWQASANATSYYVQVSTDSSFSTIQVNDTVITTSRQLSNLQYSTKYYWRVRAINSSGSSDWSVVWNFTTQVEPPSAPTLSLPANDSTGVSHSPTLSWQASANATSYYVQVSTDSSFSTIQVNDTVTTTSRQLSNLQYSTKYYWRVRAINSSGSSDWSVVWSFMTLSISLPNHWNFTSNTGNYAVIGLNPNGVYEIDNRNITNGDAIGVFYLDESEEKCAGYMIWDGQNYGIVVWGDDEFTSEKDGAYEGEELFVKVWIRKDNTIGSLRIAEARNLSEGSLIATLQYETDAILMLKGIAEFENSSLIITPQPAAEELFISYRKLPGETLKIELYNQNGSLLISQVHNSPDGVIKLDIGNIPSGVYFVVLRNGLNYAKERVVVVK